VRINGLCPQHNVRLI